MNDFAVIEMIIFAVAAFGFMGWQYWTVRDAGKPKSKRPGVAEWHHEADDGGSKPVE
jgi:hypothetical protein